MQRPSYPTKESPKKVTGTQETPQGSKKAHCSLKKKQKLCQEADEINDNVNRRQMIGLHKNFKESYMTFKKMNEKHCDTRKLKTYFKNHFNPPATSSVQIELINAPKFIKELQSLCDTDLNTDSPCKEEIIAVIKSLKND